MGEDGIKLMEDYGNMSPEEMSILLFRSMGAFGARGKCLLILLVSLLFGFFLLIPSTSGNKLLSKSVSCSNTL